jgi:hypothetical protein
MVRLAQGERKKNAGLGKAICEERLSFDWGDTCFDPESAEDLIEACDERDGVRLLCLCDDQASYGQFSTLEKYLVEAGICYRRHSDATCDLLELAWMRARRTLGRCWEWRRASAESVPNSCNRR